MTEKWNEELRRRLHDGSVKAPEGLLHGVRQEMARRGLATPPVARARRQGIVGWLTAGVAAAALLALGMAWWRQGGVAPTPTAPQRQARELRLRPEPSPPSVSAASLSHLLAQSREAAPGIRQRLALGRLGAPTAPAAPHGVMGLADAGSPMPPAALHANPLATGNGNDGGAPATPSTSQPAVSRPPHRDTHSPDINRWERPEPSPVSRQTVTLGAYYGGGAAATARHGGILLAQADPIGPHDQELSGQGVAILANTAAASAQKVSHRMPLRLGLSVDYRLANRWSLRSGVVYVRHSSTFVSGDNASATTSEQTLHYLGIPLGVSYSVLNTPRFLIYATAGGTVEKLVSGTKEARWQHMAPGQAQSVAVRERRPQCSLQLGAGMEYRVLPQLGVYLEPGMSHYIDNGSDVENIYKEKPTQLSLQMGVRLNLGR